MSLTHSTDHDFTALAIDNSVPPPAQPAGGTRPRIMPVASKSSITSRWLLRGAVGLMAITAVFVEVRHQSQTRAAADDTPRVATATVHEAATLKSEPVVLAAPAPAAIEIAPAAPPVMAPIATPAVAPVIAPPATVSRARIAPAPAPTTEPEAAVIATTATPEPAPAASAPATPDAFAALGSNPFGERPEGVAANIPSLPSREQVQRMMASANSQIQECLGDRHGLAELHVSLSPAGRVTAVRVAGALAGTPEGSCVARVLRSTPSPEFWMESFSFEFPMRF